MCFAWVGKHEVEAAEHRIGGLKESGLDMYVDNVSWDVLHGLELKATWGHYVDLRSRFSCLWEYFI